MATVAELLVKISGDSSGLRKELAATQRQMKRSFGPEGLAMTSTMAAGVGVLGAAFGAVGVAAVKMAADMEQNRIAFTTMLGSAQDAEKMLTDLATFAEKTPFEFAGLVDSTKKLMAYGFAAQEVIPMLNSIGDAVAAVGGSAEVLNRVTVAFGQMKAKGFISGEEMRQLAEAGIPAWQMLAKAIGTDIPTAMKKAEDKAIDAEAAMAGMMVQMSQKYGGMMEKQSKTITGMLSNIRDKGGAIMRTLGDEIVDALDLKTRLKGAMVFMDDFAARVKASGVREALLGMIPPELMAGIIAVSGAITAVLVVALGKLAVAAALAWGGLLGLIALIGGAIALIGTAMYQLSDASSTASKNLAASAMYMSDIQVAADGAAASVFNLSRAQLSLGAGVGSPEEYFAGTGKFSKPAPPSLGGAMPSGGGGADKLIADAKRVSEAIEREWAQTTKTQLEQLDRWQAEQLADLDKTQAANENYERDKERVAATYSVRRLKILQEEAEASKNLWESMKNGYEQLQSGIKSFGLTGSAKLNSDIDTEQKNRLDGVAKYYEDMQHRFATADNATKAEILVNLDEKGIAYRLTEQGNLDFTTARQADMLAVLEQTEQRRTEMHRTAAGIRADIDAAMQANSMTQLQAALTAENAERMANYEAQQSMMQTYLEASKAAHMTWQAALMTITAEAFSPMKSAISDMLTGAKSIGDAFAAMGQAVLKSIADIVAGWIAGQITMMAINALSSALGINNDKKQLATSISSGAATAAAWAPAAAMVSLATMGANAMPAMIGIAATTGVALGLSQVGALANGGITTGPSLNLIGEGRYQEAVLPLSDRVFGKLADGITSKGGGGQTVISPTFQISAIDGKSFEHWLNNGGGKKIRKYMGGLAANFEVVTP